MGKILVIIVLIFLVGCNSEPKKEEFRPHIVRHCNEQGKIEWYYHMEEYECPGIETDLCKECAYKKSYKNYVKFYDTKETIYGK